ncbi:MAG TPA: hypothetical protein VGU63_01230 [Candidatus Acidoferrales bacterium]|nr:hypothetical protein [Candidatus Acidoferrales bacterium]
MKKGLGCLAVLLFALPALGQNQSARVFARGYNATYIQVGTALYPVRGYCKQAKVGNNYPVEVSKDKLVLHAGDKTCKYHIDEKTKFPIKAHILKVEMGQGAQGIRGLNPATIFTPQTGISGGGSYLYHVFTVHVDGSNLEYKMTTPRGKVWPQIGDYPARWDKKTGGLIIVALDQKNGASEDPLFIAAEEPIK